MSGFFNFRKNEYPMAYIRDAVLFPDITVELNFHNQKSIQAVNSLDSTEQEKIMVVVTDWKRRQGEPFTSDLYRIGVLGRVSSINSISPELVSLQFEPEKRVEITKFLQESPYFLISTEVISDDLHLNGQGEKLKEILLAEVKKIVSTAPLFNLEVVLKLLSITEPNRLINNVMAIIDEEISIKQDILETVPINERMEKTIASLKRTLQRLNIEESVAKQTQEELSKTQKEVFLREELKTIQKELGDSESGEYENLRSSIREAKMPSAVESVALRELSHLEKTPSFSPEVSYIRNYLDWLIAMPWQRYTDGYIDLKEAKKILDEDHFGLDQVKERVLEYLAVQTLIGKIKGPILCFAGPPGTGKTSIGQSIARALGRKFIRMSLGGIRDEAEIRGHRRTYVGAMPGRIIQGIRQVGTKNPVFMLDEIDKVGSDYRGDPSSALLEALDPQQNNNFSDHYLEVPFDLSDVIFITTANILDTIPPSLRDRMEMIEFSGYTSDEKLEIANKFILPRIIKTHGLLDKGFSMSQEAIEEIIKNYTQEAGVRSLERELSKVARKIAFKIASSDNYSGKITLADLPDLLGQPKVEQWTKENQNQIGTVAALAVTEGGGEVLSVETSLIEGGKGNLTLTGNLGEVMKESALAALTYAKSKSREFGVDPQVFSNFDIHVHVPRGSIPKDGPSAGIAIASAIISALMHKPIDSDVGMTGEITLRGRILKIGGLREKVLAAKRAGLKKVIFPESNRAEMEEMPKALTREIGLYPAKSIGDILSVVMGTKSESKQQY